MKKQKKKSPPPTMTNVSAKKNVFMIGVQTTEHRHSQKLGAFDF
jgi:hypothetical protein